MAAPDQSTIKNRLLRLLSPRDYAVLAAHFEPMLFRKHHIFVVADQTFEHASFFETGIGSIVATSPEGLEAESGLFGWDGFVPVGLVMGVDHSPHRVFTQVSGHGYRIEAAKLREAIDASAALRTLLLRYAQTLGVQTAFTGLSNAVHPIDERLARWLLMCHDRTDGDELELTHEFLSLMLAVRRPSVTTALHVLEGNRFIKSERGHITIVDRAGLEEFAGDAYGRPEAEYERLIGKLR